MPFWWLFVFWHFFALLGLCDQPTVHNVGVSKGRVGGCWRLVKGDKWHTTCDTWHLTCDSWNVTHAMWHMTCDTWHGTPNTLLFYCPFLSVSVCFGISATMRTDQKVECLPWVIPCQNNEKKAQRKKVTFSRKNMKEYRVLIWFLPFLA